MSDIRQQIEASLAGFGKDDLKTVSIGLLNALGYQSEKTLDLDNTPDAFLSEFDNRDRKLRQDKALFERWKSIDLLFQLTDDEVRDAGAQGALDFGSGYEPGNYRSYLFFALDLEKDRYTRTQLAGMTREINLLFDMPAMLLIRHDGALTFSVIDRRLSRREASRDVLEKVKLIKEIHFRHPHRAHIEILHDLALPTLMAKHECRDFNQLHEAWRKTLDTNELNKRFYRELADWYFWALDHVEFPDDVEKDEATRNATSVIRLLTRLIFCWFLKEKGLIPDALFNARRLAGVLASLEDDDSTFYRAILQNLFFGTLNQRMNTGGQVNRKFANAGSFHEQKDEYGIKNLYRYQKLFAIDEDEALQIFADIPFLNGGLFDCLDKEDDVGKVIYVDGFTRNARKQPRVPNFLFFSDTRTLDLSDAFGDNTRKKEKVRGLINLLDSYKFTITENTPIEEEIALDPELLGKVFENLLASYNPETGTTARKQTGSFYTPREIVNYMVDESLIAYLAGKLEPRMDANGREAGGETTTDGADGKMATTKHAKGAKEDSREGASIRGSNLEDRLRTLFAYTEEPHAFSDGEVDVLIEAIDTCKILDPACGSGAFPMGILHKLVFILGKLDPHNERWKRKQVEKAEQIPDVSARETAVAAIEKDFETNDLDYGRKLYLIENCIYGVDIQPIAIQISKLRFFISLICDQRTNRNKARNCGVRPLPNLETKFVAANTLISLDRGEGQGLLMDRRLPALEKQLADIRHKHFAAQRRRDKLALQKQDAKLREEIAAVLADGGMSGDASHQLAAWDPYDQNNSAPFFDPEWMYGIADGFDVVIGNPPYGIPTKLTGICDSVSGSIDSYAAFMLVSLALLTRSDGIVTLIIPITWQTGEKFASIRSALREFASILAVINLPYDIFSAAYIDTCVLCLRKGIRASNTYLAALLDKKNERLGINWITSQLRPIRTPDGTGDAIFVVPEVASILSRVTQRKKVLIEDILDAKRGIEAYKYQFSDSGGQGFTPFFTGNIYRYRQEGGASEYVAISRSEERFHSGPRLAVRRIVSRSNRLMATLLEDSFVVKKDVYTLIGLPRDELLFVLGLLNSALLSYLIQGSYIAASKDDFRQVSLAALRGLPIPAVETREKKTIASCAENLLSDPKNSELERRIDEVVFSAFGLSASQVSYVLSFLERNG
jgi:adenine-specific DNA-methyltransferase